jgi:type II secretory ATPase GspE/PulE/Tfp pilus assembly ATPase PilB-like protein
MADLMATSQRFSARRFELHLSPDGVALTRNGEVLSDPDYQAADYDEVASAQLDRKGRRLTILFTSDRPVWTIKGMKRPEAAWAQTLINEAVERNRLHKESCFAERLTGEGLREAVNRFAQADPPQPAVLGDLILVQALRNRATDLHVQPEPECALVRYRVDGRLADVATLPPDRAERLVSALKVRAGMKTYRRNVAQTGRSSIGLGKRAVDLRFTCMPTTHGERVTVRIFDPARALLDLDALGMDAPLLDAYRGLITQPHGCILFTGPSGSGKTTTMYASLGSLRDANPERSFATVEEPVELDLAGVSQTEVDRDVGLDFAEGLRNALRQDPQVLMVGEIRDPETANIAIQAGLTGHLVFSTVHAPSAAGVFTRLTQIGVEPYLAASSVTAVVAQRLVRKVCDACAEAHSPSSAEMQAAGLDADQLTEPSMQRGRGCERCDETGYRDRTGLFALVPVTPRLRESIMACRPLAELEEIAAQDAVGSLWEAGLAKLRQGVTTLDELQAVLGRRAS